MSNPSSPVQAQSVESALDELMAWARARAPLYAVDALPEALLDQLAADAGVLASEWEMPDISFPLPLLDGRVHLFVQADLPPACKQAIILEEVGRAVLARRRAIPAPKDVPAARCFAVAGVLVRSASHQVRAAFQELEAGFGEDWLAYLESELLPTLRPVLQGAWTARGAYDRGCRARREGAAEVAEAEFQRAIALASSEADWDVVARAQIGLGNLHRQLGGLPSAHRHYRHAARTVERHGLQQLRGPVAHERFVASFEVGDASAEQHALAAVAGYADDPPGLVRLASDVAAWWLLQGRFAEAAVALRRILPHLDDERVAMSQWANYGRACGALGDQAEYARAWERVWVDAVRIRSGEEVAQALLDLAYGASSLAMWDRALSAAETAATLARERHESRVLLEAEAFLESLSADRAAAMHATTRPVRQTPRPARLVSALEAAVCGALDCSRQPTPDPE